MPTIDRDEVMRACDKAVLRCRTKAERLRGLAGFRDLMQGWARAEAEIEELQRRLAALPAEEKP